MADPADSSSACGERLVTIPKLAELRARRAATGQTDSFADHRATYEDATEEALFSPLRAAVREALALPGAPQRVELARAIGYAPESLTAWLNGRRPAPVDKIEAMLVHLDLVIVPRASTTHTAPHAPR